MPRMAARYMLSKHWDGELPVDPFAIARSAGVTVEHDPEMEPKELGRFEYVKGKPRIYTNPNEPVSRFRYVVAHELGHFALNHGKRFVDTAFQFWPVHYDRAEHQANQFALELLVPDFALNNMIEKRNITHPVRLKEIFAVSDLAIKLRLKKLKWIY
jgi:Zn-dependent peptidase ImmA (M78 family)